MAKTSSKKPAQRSKLKKLSLKDLENYRGGYGPGGLDESMKKADDSALKSAGADSNAKRAGSAPS